jgi:hypothetical protein
MPNTLEQTDLGTRNDTFRSTLRHPHRFMRHLLLIATMLCLYSAVSILLDGSVELQNARAQGVGRYVPGDDANYWWYYKRFQETANPFWKDKMRGIERHQQNRACFGHGTPSGCPDGPCSNCCSGAADAGKCL